jgi:hypothetical protein
MSKRKGKINKIKNIFSLLKSLMYNLFCFDVALFEYIIHALYSFTCCVFKPSWIDSVNKGGDK